MWPLVGAVSVAEWWARMRAYKSAMWVSYNLNRGGLTLSLVRFPPPWHWLIWHQLLMVVVCQTVVDFLHAHALIAMRELALTCLFCGSCCFPVQIPQPVVERSVCIAKPIVYPRVLNTPQGYQTIKPCSFLMVYSFSVVISIRPLGTFEWLVCCERNKTNVSPCVVTKGWMYSAM